MTKFDLPQVTLCSWQDIKIQLLIMNYLEGHGHSKGSAPETNYCLLHISWNIELFASKLCDGTLLKAGITYNKFVSLSSRSHVGFSFSRNDCVFHIIWTDEAGELYKWFWCTLQHQIKVSIQILCVCPFFWATWFQDNRESAIFDHAWLGKRIMEGGKIPLNRNEKMKKN